MAAVVLADGGTQLALWGAGAPERHVPQAPPPPPLQLVPRAPRRLSAAEDAVARALGAALVARYRADHLADTAAGNRGAMDGSDRMEDA